MTPQALAQFKSDLKEIVAYLLSFLQNPVQAIRRVPLWGWRAILATQGVLAAFAGLASGIVTGKILQMFMGFFFFPFTVTIVTSIIAGFLYYWFLFIFRKQTSFKVHYTLIVFANLPMQVLFVLSDWIPPINLIGFAITTLLLIVGLVENFQIDRKPVMRLVGSLYVIYVIVWLAHSLQNIQLIEKIDRISRPESLDILEKEMREN